MLSNIYHEILKNLSYHDILRALVYLRLWYILKLKHIQNPDEYLRRGFLLGTLIITVTDLDN